MQQPTSSRSSLSHTHMPKEDNVFGLSRFVSVQFEPAMTPTNHSHVPTHLSPSPHCSLPHHTNTRSSVLKQKTGRHHLTPSSPTDRTAHTRITVHDVPPRGARVNIGPCIAFNSVEKQGQNGCTRGVLSPRDRLGVVRDDQKKTPHRWWRRDLTPSWFRRG